MLRLMPEICKTQEQETGPFAALPAGGSSLGLKLSSAGVPGEAAVLLAQMVLKPIAGSFAHL
jgi:hypothetical protein